MPRTSKRTAKLPKVRPGRTNAADGEIVNSSTEGNLEIVAKNQTTAGRGSNNGRMAGEPDKREFVPFRAAYVSDDAYESDESMNSILLRHSYSN